MEILHKKYDNYNIPIDANCQIEYLKRCDKWERGILAVPHTLNRPNYRLTQIYPRHVYFDLETLYMPDDIGYSRSYGNENRGEVIPQQRLGLGVTLDYKGKVECWDECGVKELINYLLEYDSLVSFNGLRFDNLVLSRYASSAEIGEIYYKTFDLLEYVENLTGVRRSLEFISDRLGIGANEAKFLIKQGFGYEEGKLVKGFTSFPPRRNMENAGNSIPLILRAGAAAQKRLVWVACFEDVFNMAATVEELVLEKSMMQYKNGGLDGDNHAWIFR